MNQNKQFLYKIFLMNWIYYFKGVFNQLVIRSFIEKAHKLDKIAILSALFWNEGLI